jgi:hypothetical protein
MSPGEIMFTRAPKGASSVASDFMSTTSALFAAA